MGSKELILKSTHRPKRVMASHIHSFCSIVLTTALLVPLARRQATAPHRQDPPSRCTKEALAELKSIPKLKYKCSDDPDDVIEKSPTRRAALRAYLTKLQSGVGPSFWAASVDNLNACATTNKARALTTDEQRELDSNPEVYGDQSTRLLIVPDPCIRYSYITQNGFILYHSGGRTYATQVLDAFYSRLDPGVELQLARHNDEIVIVIQTNSEPMMTTLFSTYHVYSIDPTTHHAVPKKLFMQSGKLTNEFEFDQYLFDDGETRKHWHAPELVHEGKLSPRFTVYRMKEDQENIADPGSKFSRKTYVWNGRYYAPR